MKKIKKFPIQKAKLITDGGFYKIIDLKEVKHNSGFIPVISIPLTKRITIASPEINYFDTVHSFECQFRFERVYRGYAEYRQFNVIS